MSKMAGTKRPADGLTTRPSKKTKSAPKSAKPGPPAKRRIHEDDVDENDSDNFDEFDNDALSNEADETNAQLRNGNARSKDKAGPSKTLPGKYIADEQKNNMQKDTFLKEGKSSREAHAEQKKLALQRKAAKPNADSIHRAKKLWEKLRIKTNVPKDERKKLVEELFSIVNGRVNEFVFKHDSVRVIQCALKYATPAQKKEIARELRGSYRELAESKYAKFLVAKLVMIGDEVRNWVIEEFYGHVKRLIRHPEAGWIVDDIYRAIATKEQKARLLREWYGPEFAVMKVEGPVASDLTKILEEVPAKRGPIMTHLKEMTNQLVQKKTTGFTILHDALLQYFLNCRPASSEQTEFLDMLRDDEEGDLFKNLAFTKSGSRLVCLALAYGSAKDRRSILKVFKTHIKSLAGDAHGCHVILAAYEVIDDTVMISKAIFPELLSKDLEPEAKEQELLSQATHLIARIPLLWLMSPTPAKWLITEAESAMLEEIRAIRKDTSKKDPEKRRTELVEGLSQPLLDLVASQAPALAQSSFGSQFVTEVTFGSVGEKQPALEAVAGLMNAKSPLLNEAHIGRMLKSLVQGGPFDKATKSIVPVDPPLGFENLLYQRAISDDMNKALEWASGANSFIVLAMLESSTFQHHDELTAHLKAHIPQISSENPGGRHILEKIGATPPEERKKNPKSKKAKTKR